MSDRPMVLIVDDHPEEIASTISHLRTRSLRISIADNARTGMYRARSLSPHIILLDVNMPDMDGFAMCRLLQADPGTRGIPIIFLTSQGAGAQRIDGLEGGAVDYIVKPCLPAEVAARVQIHLRLAGHHEASEPLAREASLAPDDMTLQAALRLIGDNLGNPPHLADLAASVGTHERKLSLIFKQQLGVTVFAWIREERLRRARKLLVDTRMSTADIADELGFHSANNFITAFRKRTGVTPGAYRNSARKPDDDGHAMA